MNLDRQKDQQVMRAATETGLSDGVHYLKHGKTSQGMTVINVLPSLQ